MRDEVCVEEGKEVMNVGDEKRRDEEIGTVDEETCGQIGSVDEDVERRDDYPQMIVVADDCEGRGEKKQEVKMGRDEAGGGEATEKDESRREGMNTEVSELKSPDLHVDMKLIAEVESESRDSNNEFSMTTPTSSLLPEDEGEDGKSQSLRMEGNADQERQQEIEIPAFMPLSPKSLSTLPSLRGTLTQIQPQTLEIFNQDGNSPGRTVGAYIFKGEWALSDAAHTSGQKAEFELTLVGPNIGGSEANESSGESTREPPFAGKYSGFFMLKAGKNMIKHEDTVDLKFEVCSSSSGTMDVDGNDNVTNTADGVNEQIFDVSGSGSNHFGRFLVQGGLRKDNSMFFYKVCF